MQSNKEWFKEARFGMFIHWGIYSVLGRGEWVMERERIPVREYEKLADKFNPKRFDARQWVTTAKKAGMKYIAFTTKHHDGFCMYDSKVTDFTSVRSRAKRDFTKEIVSACRKAGLKIFFYFSPLDWHHPDWTLGHRKLDWARGFKDKTAEKRYMKYQHRQVMELCSQYGKVDGLWYDGVWWGAKKMKASLLNRNVRKLQKDIIINDRSGHIMAIKHQLQPCFKDSWLSMQEEDFDTPEQTIAPSQKGRMWESCMTLNDNWGYNRYDHNYKSAYEVVRMLIQVAAGAGNLVLNVGPKMDGTFPAEAEKILKQAGDWLKVNGEAVYGSERCMFPMPSSPFDWFPFGLATQRGNNLYLHFLHWHYPEAVAVGIKNKVRSARMLANNKKVIFEQKKDRLFLKNLPKNSPDKIVPVIKLELDGKPRIYW